MAPSAEHHEPFGGSSVIGKPHSHRGRNTIVIVAIVCLIVLAAIYALGMLNGDGGNDEPTTEPGALGIGSPSPSASKTPKPTPSSTADPGVAEEPRQDHRRATATAGWRSGATTAPASSSSRAR